MMQAILTLRDDLKRQTQLVRETGKYIQKLERELINTKLQNIELRERIERLESTLRHQQE